MRIIQYNEQELSKNFGNYNLVNLPIGNYVVEVEMPGFKRSVSGSFRLVVDQKLRSDFKLEIGEQTDTIFSAEYGHTARRRSAGFLADWDPESDWAGHHPPGW